MTETEFLARAEHTLAVIEAALARVSDESDIDIDTHRSGNVLTIELTNQSRLVINSQSSMQQLWVAARSGGYHYALAEDGCWRDTRDGSELFAALSQLLTAQGGAPVTLAMSTSAN